MPWSFALYIPPSSNVTRVFRRSVYADLHGTKEQHSLWYFEAAQSPADRFLMYNSSLYTILYSQISLSGLGSTHRDSCLETHNSQLSTAVGIYKKKLEFEGPHKKERCDSCAPDSPWVPLLFSMHDFLSPLLFQAPSEDHKEEQSREQTNKRKNI